MIPLLVAVYVDLQQAILGTQDGKRAKSALEEQHTRINREIREKEERLIRDRKGLDPAKYDEAAKKIQEEIAAKQEALDKKQDELLAPIVERMQKLVREHNAKGAEPLVVDRSEQRLVDPPKECDLTSWLVRAYSAQNPVPVQPMNPCRFEGFAYVDFDQALAQSEAGKAATKALDREKEKAQEEIDRRQRQLAEMQRAAADRPQAREQYELERREVAQLFTKMQRDLSEKERQTEDRLYGQIEGGIAALRKKRPGLLFVEMPEEGVEKLSPSCDLTEWASQMIDGKTEAPRCAF